MFKNWKRLALAAGLSLTLFAAACGGGADEDTGENGGDT